MEVILLESVRKLGTVGAKVKVKDGYGRNYLIPRNKALRATKQNLAIFEQSKAEIESGNSAKRDEARTYAVNLDNIMISLIKQAGEDGRLFGSVTARDIVNALNNQGLKIERNMVVLDNPIKNTGIHKITISLHPEVNVNVQVNVARTEAEASEVANKNISKQKSSDLDKAE
jgi:large subunit ribosomal protein L9